MSDQANVNHIGLSKADYSGAPSTLCNGCGHFMIVGVISTTLRL